MRRTSETHNSIEDLSISCAVGDLACSRYFECSYHDGHDVFRIAFCTGVSLSVFTLEES